jgi:protein-S-isoprenylcysteine O-methyltransferase Ste14
MRAVAEWLVPICWVTFGIVWIVGAFTAKPVAAGQGIWRRWCYRLVFVALLVAITGRSTRTMTIDLGSVAWAVLMSADVITVVGLVIAVWSRVALGVYWSGIVVVKEGHVIIERGPYRFVRHPIYLGVLLMVLGTAVLWGSRSGLVIFVVVLAGLGAKARFEERLLSARLPAEYGAYKTRVKYALVPWVL